MRIITKLCLTTCLLFLFQFANAQKNVNKYRIFIGAGNNNSVSDFVSLTDKSFLGEISGQLRAGIRIVDNLEISAGAHYRKFPDIPAGGDLTYNQLLGYSAALMYEFRKPDSRWGVPFGVEAVKYRRHLDSALSGGGKVYDHYDASGYGPKIGVRCHFGRFFFIEAEVEFLYEHFIQDVDWEEKIFYDDYTLTSFKFFGISANLSF